MLSRSNKCYGTWHGDYYRLCYEIKTRGRVAVSILEGWIFVEANCGIDDSVKIRRNKKRAAILFLYKMFPCTKWTSQREVCVWKYNYTGVFKKINFLFVKN